MTIEDQVIEEDVEEVSEEAEATEETPQDEGVSVKETPGKSEIDVESLRAEYDQKLQRATDDLNKMKSTFQRKETELQKQYAQRQTELQKQLRQIQMQGMDEDQRKAYEVQMQSEEMQTLQSQLSEMSRKNQELAAVLDAQQFFVSKGVPIEKLILNQGYDALVTSGWDAVSEELNSYREKASKSAKPQSPRKPAPAVVTDKSTPSRGTTWVELRKKYGSDENVYQAIEQGLLDPNILPGS